LRLNRIDVTLQPGVARKFIGEIDMPHLQTALGNLNVAFAHDNLAKLAQHREAFAPGKPLAAGIVVDEKMALQPYWKKYLSEIPPAMQEALRAIIYQALSTTPPTQITFAWAAGYDFELSVWQAPDTKTSKGGITILLKSRYPDDKHPISG
jgi:hypothetical protein